MWMDRIAVYLVFKLKTHTRDKNLLEGIRNYLDNIGNITARGEDFRKTQERF